MKREIVIAVWTALAFGCVAEPEEAEMRKIIENLKQAGFPADDIMVVNGKVYVGRDAEVSLAASREMIEVEDSSKEQYQTTNLVGSSITKICVNGSAFTGVFSTALDLAIQNYDEQSLRFAMVRTPSSGCSFTINAVIKLGVVGGSAGFPSDGLPYSTINIGDGLASYGVDVIEHVITHELGHTIGFRHSDYYNRSISCGTGGNEDDAGVGAIHIPGTPTTATIGGSVMNSCFRSVETGEFTGTDLTALQRLYVVSNFGSAVSSFDGTLDIANLDGTGHYLIAAVDVTGDRRADLVSAHTDGSVHVWPGQVNGAFGSAGSSFAGTLDIANLDGTGHYLIAAADVTGDGHADLISAHTDGNAYVWPGRSNGTFGSAVSSFAGTLDIANLDGTGHYLLAAADVTGNGRADLVSVHTSGSAYVWPAK